MFVERWNNATKDDDGEQNSFFLKKRYICDQKP